MLVVGKMVPSMVMAYYLQIVSLIFLYFKKLNFLGERYMGMWFNDQKHGKGCIINIDGTFHEGIFDRDKFIVKFLIKLFVIFNI